MFWKESQAFPECLEFNGLIDYFLDFYGWQKQKCMFLFFSELPLSDLPLSDLPLSELPLSDLPLSDLPLFDLPLSDLP
jgi:hypothetical protein